MFLVFVSFSSRALLAQFSSLRFQQMKFLFPLDCLSFVFFPSLSWRGYEGLPLDHPRMHPRRAQPAQPTQAGAVAVAVAGEFVAGGWEGKSSALGPLGPHLSPERTAAAAEAQVQLALFCSGAIYEPDPQVDSRTPPLLPPPPPHTDSIIGSAPSAPLLRHHFYYHHIAALNYHHHRRLLTVTALCF